MHYALMPAALAMLALTGCAGVDAPSPQRTAAVNTTPGRVATYMTPEQSSRLIILPGDTTTPVQLRYLSDHQSNAELVMPDEDFQQSPKLVLDW